MRLPLPIAIDPISFLFGLAIATILWWAMARVRPLWKDIRGNIQRQRERARERRTSGLEEDHRRVTFRRAQGMHLAAPLFALEEILLEPELLAPPPRVEPGNLGGIEDAVSQTVPYLPSWPELAAIYRAPTITLGEALAGGANLAIIGQPGMGKTVALAHLASLAANRSATLGALQDAIPFLLHVGDLRLPISDTRDLLGRITEMTSEGVSVFDMGRVEGFVQTSFRSGRALLVLDGFDELTSEGQRDVAGFLKKLLREYPRIRVVTTGAPEYLDGLVALGFAPLPIAAWSRQHQARFIGQWGRLWSNSVGLETWAQDAHDDADPLLLGAWIQQTTQTSTPLELTLKIWAAYAGDWLGPANLDAVAAHVRRLAPANTPSAALEALAIQVMLTAQPIFDPRKARDWVKEFELPEEAELQGQAPERLTDNEKDEPPEADKQKSRPQNLPTPTPGLLGRLATTGLVHPVSQNRMRFVHPVIGGYLAGRGLSSYKAEQTLINEPDWIGKLLTMRYFAAHGDAGPLVDSMLQWSRLPMHRPLLTAARWLHDAPRSASWRDRLMAALAQLLQTEGLPLSLRGQALAAFAFSADPGAAALFRQLANTRSFELMRLVALGSGAVRDEQAVNDLEGMMRAPSISTQRAACLALVAIGTMRALESVAQAVLHADEELRRAAAEALANDPMEGHAMLKDGATMADIPLRRATVYGLGRVRESWANELLEKMRVEDDQWVVRNSASEVLEAQTQDGNPHVPRPLRPPSESPWLIAFAGTQGVGISPGAPATDLLLAALKSAKEDERLAALAYLKRNPTDGIVRQMYSCMFGDDPDLKEAAYLALWEIGTSGYKLPDPSQYGLS